MKCSFTASKIGSHWKHLSRLGLCSSGLGHYSQEIELSTFHLATPIFLVMPACLQHAHVVSRLTRSNFKNQPMLTY
jgi:hypothetical protein